MSLTRNSRVVLKVCVCWLLAGAQALKGQIALDGTLGLKTTLSGPNYGITADLGRQVGPNLFHSFSEFNIRSGESATFSGPAEVQNILNRVTGGTASSINGTIRSTIPGANFYLLNPAGVEMQNGAKVDVSGSFTVSTANYLTLGESGRFDATTPEKSVLTSAPVEAFGFLDSHSGRITVQQSQLNVPNGKSLSLVGGDVVVSGGRIEAVGGAIELVSVRSPGEVRKVPIDASRLDWDVGSFSEGGRVTLTEATTVQASEGGHVVIRGGELTMEGSSILARNTGSASGGRIDVVVREELTLDRDSKMTSEASGSGLGADTDVGARRLSVVAGEISSVTFGDGQGGDITVRAESVQIEGQPGRQPAGIVTSTSDQSTGAAGDILVEAPQLSLTSLGAISSRTDGRGPGGNVTIQSEEIVLSGQGSRAYIESSTTRASQGGDAGNISVQTQTLELKNGGFVQTETRGSGHAGDIEVQAEEEVVVDGQGGRASISAFTYAVSQGGDAGAITLRTKTLELKDGGVIDSRTSGSGNGGTIDVEAENEIVIDGQDGISGIFADTHAESQAGIGGGINLLSKRLELKSGWISSSTLGSGKGGSINLRAQEVLIEYGGIEASTIQAQHGGDAGIITIRASTVALRNSGFIGGLTQGSGRGASVQVQAERIDMIGAPPENGRLQSAMIGTSALPRPDSTLTTGSGGDILILTDQLNMMRESRIGAETWGSGNGGNIRIFADEIVVDGQGGRTFLANTQRVVDAGGVIGLANATIDSSSNADLIGLPNGGNAGEIHVRTGSLELRTGSVTSEGTGTGNAGSVFVIARDSLDLVDSVITTSAVIAAAGNITIQSGSKITLRDSIIASQAARDGGNIQLLAPELLYLLDSHVTAKAGDNGGNVIIDPQFVVLNRGQVSAKAVRGDGGDIRITTDALLQSVESEISASSEFGLDGTITILGPSIDLGGTLAGFQTSLMNAQSQLPDHCGIRLGADISSFLVVGQGGIPLQPDGWQPSGFMPANDANEREMEDK